MGLKKHKTCLGDYDTAPEIIATILAIVAIVEFCYWMVVLG